MPRQTDPQPLAARSADDLRVLAAACDMAVERALELVGKRVARVDRVRFGTMQKSGMAWTEAHTAWRATPSQVDAALSGAWSGLPRLVSEHGCCALVEPAVTALLDGYVRELVASMAPHSYEELERRLRGAAAS